MPVVGTLTVDLVANTATFTADLGKAGNSLDGFGKDAENAGRRMDFSMREAKGSMALLGEEFGIHVPRHLRALIAEIPGVGAAFAEMLPIVGVVAAIAIITHLMDKADEAKEKLSQGWDTLNADIAKVFDGLDDKLLQAGKTADELKGDHLAALRKELDLIDHQSMRELAGEFSKLSKAADSVLGQLKSSWYEIRTGSQGAQNALDSFRGKYELLLAQGKDKDANDLLKGTTDSAKTRLAEMEHFQNTAFAPSQKMLESQRALVDVLNAQVTATAKMAALKTVEKGNAVTKEDNGEQERQHKIYEAQQHGLEQRRQAEARYAKEQSAMHKKATEEDQRIANEQFQATESFAAANAKVQDGLAKESLKQTEAMAKLSQAAEERAAKHSLAMHRVTAQQAVDAEIKAAQASLKVQVDALDQEINSLDKHDANYIVKLQEFENRKRQIVRQSGNEVAKIREAAEERQYQVVRHAEERMADAVAKNMARGIFESKNMAQAFAQMGAQMLESATENTIKMILLGDMKQAKDAGHAAASAFKWVMEDVPFPFNIAVAPVAAAAAFAGVMAFEQGGEIPGSGAVPIIAHGGESVVTKALTDQVKSNVGGSGGHSFHFAPVIHAIDGDGVDRMLRQHATTFERHVTATLRKQNKRG